MADIIVSPSAADADFTYQFPDALEEDTTSSSETVATAKHIYGPMASNVMAMARLQAGTQLFMAQNYFI